MKRRHRVRTALGASTALAVGAGIALASVPRVAQPTSKPVTQNQVSATYSTTSAELARLRAQLAGSAHDTALLRSLITRLQHEIDTAQARLEQLPRVGGHAATSPKVIPTPPARPKRTTAATRSHQSPGPPPSSSPPTTPTPTTPTPSDDDGSGDD